MPPETLDFNQIEQRVREIYQLIISSQIQNRIFLLKVVFILFSFLFLLGIIFFLLRSNYLKEVRLKDMEDISNYKDFGQKKWLKRWKKIKKISEKRSFQQQKLSLIQAYKMFDDVLKKIGLGGESVEERLQRLQESDMLGFSQITEANQVCQDIVKDTAYKLDKEKTREVIDIFEKTFQDLQVF